MEAIRKDADIKPETEKKLTEFLTSFTASFA